MASHSLNRAGTIGAPVRSYPAVLPAAVAVITAGLLGASLAPQPLPGAATLKMAMKVAVIYLSNSRG